ncbi:MAG TPA: hypothetical protein VFA99_11930 [Acidobacteriaceae bacterium]|nr:hypothetical protein [Acidobacteriaceae bacterium]
MTKNMFEMEKKAFEIDKQNCHQVAANVAISNKEMGSEVMKSVGRLELVHVSRNIRRTELREGTTGRPITARLNLVPRIMAVAEPPAAPVENPQPVHPQPKVELAFYRKYTEAMLRRYTRISMQPGRTPALLGRELFQGDASHTTLTTFEDGIVFCIDVERCLAKLRPIDRRLIQRMSIQGYTPEEAAQLLGLSLRSCFRGHSEALDRLTEIFLTARFFEPLKSCQDVDAVEN